MTVLKALVWCGFAVAVVGPLGILFNIAPYALAPFYLNWPAQPPGAIEGQMSDAEVRRRLRAMRKFTASPQAAATSVDSLTVIGIRFSEPRKTDAAPADAQVAAQSAKPPAYFPVTLDLSQSNRNGVVTIADKAIEWTISPPPSPRPRAVFGLESRLFPAFNNVPYGVLAGFRIGQADGRIAKPLDPNDASSGDIAKFCRSLADWANYFSVPIENVSYMLVDAPKRLTFDGSDWTTKANIALRLDNEELRNGCGTSYAEAWR